MLRAPLLAAILQVAVGHGASPRAESTVLPPPLLDVALAEPPRVEGETKTAVAPRVQPRAVRRETRCSGRALFFLREWREEGA